MQNPNQVSQPYLTYQPHSKQVEFHRDRYEVFARWVIAATGAGKTKVGAYEALLWLTELPGVVGYAFEPTYKMVTRNLIPTLQDPDLLGYPIESNPLVTNFNQTENRITFWNGSQLWLMGLEDPESAEGPNVDFIWSDETRLLRHLADAWKVWMRRLRGSIPGKYPVGFWGTTTPDFPNSELFALSEDPKTKIQNSKIYRWGINDNPYLTTQYKDEIKRSHSGGLYDRFVLGRFAAAGTSSFEFDSTIHVLEKIDLSIIREVIYGVDAGWTNPAAIIAVGFDGDGRAYVLDEYYARMRPDEDLVKEAVEMQGLYGRGPFIVDSSTPQLIEKLRRAGLNAKGNESKRDDGIRELGGRFKKAGDGRPRIYVDKKCVNLISELQTYDEKVKENDHATDSLRYSITYKITKISNGVFIFGGGVR